jgi:TolB-like protein
VSLVAELKRRNVFRVGAAYAVLAWVVMQVVDIVLPTFDAPRWVNQTLLFLIILGFPVALVLAWVFDLTPDGIKATSDLASETSKRPQAGQKLNYLITAGLALVVVMMVIKQGLEPDASTDAVAVAAEVTTTAAPPTSLPDIIEDSIAVLPFDNLSPDPDDAFFAAGLHDEILNQLSKIRNLKVISRQSVLRYADSELTIPEIAQELRVSNIMEGSVRYAGDRIRVTAQLIDTATDEHLWSETFDMDFADVFEAESQIAMNVANAMQVNFSEEEQAALEKIPTQSSQAYALYLEALSLWSDIEFGDTAAGDNAQQLLDQAIALDAGFATAYMEKADIHRFFQQIPQAREYASKALALDPAVGRADLLEVHLLNSELRYAEAVPLINTFLERHPYDLDALIAGIDAHWGSFDMAGALALAEKVYAIEQTPRAFSMMGLSYSRLGRHEEALPYLQEVVRLNPQSATAQLELAFSLAALGRTDDAVAWISSIKDEVLGKNEEKNAGGNLYSALIYANAVAGRDAEARRLFAKFQQDAEAASDLPTRARAYISAGELDQGLLLLQQMSTDRSVNNRNTTNAIKLLKVNPHHLPALERPEFVAARENL